MSLVIANSGNVIRKLTTRVKSNRKSSQSQETLKVVVQNLDILLKASVTNMDFKLVVI